MQARRRARFTCSRSVTGRPGGPSGSRPVLHAAREPYCRAFDVPRQSNRFPRFADVRWRADWSVARKNRQHTRGGVGSGPSRRPGPRAGQGHRPRSSIVKSKVGAQVPAMCAHAGAGIELRRPVGHVDGWSTGGSRTGRVASGQRRCACDRGPGPGRSRMTRRNLAPANRFVAGAATAVTDASLHIASIDAALGRSQQGFP